MRRSVPLLITTLILTATPLLAVSPADAAQAGRCDGKKPTIVSDAKEVTGTARDDVIVVTGRGPSQVEAGAGDDTVCLRRRGYVQVDAGSGDDTVVSQERRGRPNTVLGPGDDTYVGSDGRDSVADADLCCGQRAGGVNTIRTRGGTDYVTIGHRRGPSRDTVDLGRGDDSLTVLRGKDHRRADLTGGEGADALSLYLPLRGLFAVDAEQGTASIGGAPFVHWSAFEEYDLLSQGAVSFTGTAGDDTVALVGPGPITATTGAGDDTVAVSPFSTSSGSIDGGDGEDVVDYSSHADIVGDVATGAITTEGVTLTVTSVERWGVNSAGSVELTGSSGDDVLRADACSVTLRGGGGNDQLTAGREPGDEGFFVSYSPDSPPGRCGAPTSKVYGEAGDDVLISGDSFASYARRKPRERVSLLDGGDGIDVAIGGDGRVACLAETRVSCED